MLEAALEKLSTAGILMFWLWTCSREHWMCKDTA